MMRLAAFALVVIVCVPAMAQQQSPQRRPVERELLDIEQEVDKTLLREALLLQGRARMKGVPDDKAEAKQYEKDAKVLEEFIARKKEAITERAAEVTNKLMANRPTMTLEAPADQSAKHQAAIEKIETGKVEVQLLAAQIELLQEPLSKAVENLAAADLSSSKDETLRAKAEEARKDYDKIKARYVELNKRLQIEQEGMQSLQQSFGMGGFGGGMR
jgi:hypothetical protein